MYLGRERENTEPAIYKFFRVRSGAVDISAGIKRVRAGPKPGLHRGSTGWSWTLGRSGNNIYIYYLPISNTVSEKSEQRVRCARFFAHLTATANPGLPRWCAPAETGLPGRISSHFVPVSRRVSCWKAPGCIPVRKMRVLLLLLFSIFPSFLYSKKSSIEPLPNYIRICPIQEEGSPHGGIIFSAGGPGSRARQVGKVVPTIETHPGDILMPRIEPRRQGKPGERGFPRLLHQGAHPIELGCRGATQNPTNHQCRLSIHIRNAWSANMPDQPPTGALEKP